MKKMLEKRKILIKEYEDLCMREEKAEERVQNNLRSNDIFYEVDQAHFQLAKDRIVCALQQTQKPFLEEYCRLAQEILELVETKCANSGRVEDKEEVVFARKRVEVNNTVKESADAVAHENDSDVYEMGLIMNEIDNIICIKDQTMLNQALVNFRILKDMAKICPFEEEQKNFKHIQDAIASMKEKLEVLKAAEMGE